MGTVRSFVLSARLTTIPLSLLGDSEILVLLADRVRQGHLVVLCGDSNAGARATGTTVEQRRLIASIEAKTRSKLSYQGRQHKLVADADFGKLPQRDAYEVVRHDEAVRVLNGLASQPGTSPDLSRLLDSARDKLTSDWRPPRPPDGLILLRRATMAVAPRPDEAPITPSQMKSMLAKEQEATLEIVVLGAGDKPMPDIEFTFAAPDEQDDQQGELGAAGKTSVKSSRPGAGSVTIKMKKRS
jgi:hypothetical protein